MESKNRPHIAVLMSTYNGERFIEQQVESILNQICVDVTLIIRDDGSTDGTVDLIRSFQAVNANVVLLKSTRNLGPAMSFIKLLKSVVAMKMNYNYYAFADQDDIWLENKLQAAVSKISNQSVPLLYCSNQIIYKSNKKCGLRFNTPPDLSLEGHITKNLLSGCTFVFNHALAERIIQTGIPDRTIMDYRLHDSWIFLEALVCGHVIYDHNSYILYRIHDNNAVGLKQLTALERIKRVLGLNSYKKSIKNLRMKTATELLKRFSEMNTEMKRFLEIVAYYKQGLGRRVLLMKQERIYELSGEGRYIFLLKVLLGFV